MRKHLEPMVKRVMESAYIATASKEMLKTLTGESDAERAPHMTEPCTIGLVLRADCNKSIESALKEQLANEWDIIARKIEPEILKQRGILECEPLGNIKYVIS